MTTIAVAIVGRAITIWEAIQKRSHEPIYKNYTKMKKRDLEQQLCYRKVGRAITKGRAIEKSLILLLQYWINEEFKLIQQALLINIEWLAIFFFYFLEITLTNPIL